ncbi:hypothetical protein D9M72_388430 [compost metagenome]
MIEKIAGGAEGDRPARRAPASPEADPARFHQHVERALRRLNPADILDLRAGHRLVVGNDGKNFERSARELADLLFVGLHDEGEIGCRAESPMVGDLNQVDAARRVERLQPHHDATDIGTTRQATFDIGLRHRLRRSKHQGFRDPLGFLLHPRIEGRRRSDLIVLVGSFGHVLLGFSHGLPPFRQASPHRSGSVRAEDRWAQRPLPGGSPAGPREPSRAKLRRNWRSPLPAPSASSCSG